jgi:hypothetical protein
MLRFGLLALVVGCGGAGGLTIDDVQADVQIASPTCMQFGADSVDIMVEGLTTMAEGNVFEAEINALGQGVVTEFYSCGNWDEIFNGSESAGCIRSAGEPISMQAVNVSHDVSGGSFPMPATVIITVRVLSTRNGSQLASDSVQFNCQLN